MERAMVSCVVVFGEAESVLAEDLAAGGSGVSWSLCRPEEVSDRLVASAQPAVVVGVGSAGSAALQAAADDGSVCGIVLWDTPLVGGDLELLGEWPEVAVLGVAHASDRHSLRSVADAFLASAHPDSDLVVAGVADSAADDAATARVHSWIASRSNVSASAEEVAFAGADGWELHGTRWLPQRDSPVPGVVLLHTGRSDRAAYSRLQRLLAEAGLAVLNLDWRGRGESINQGSYFDLAPETRDLAWQDALAALDHLAGLETVDESRLATVGTVHGAEYAVRAACRDPRVVAVVLLTGYRPQDQSEATHLTSGAVDTLYIACTGHQITTQAMRELHSAAPPGRSQYLEYPGSALGYQLFELDHDLEPRVVGWLAEVLDR
ncbi:MAG: alpha/beta hydrolase [Acidimicrobiaceae bacterium]|nr:alpha/beta hydrolase [Acidimicrobiaceae bacterium]